MESFGERLKYIINMCYGDSSQFSKLFDIHYQTLYNYTKNIRFPDADTFAKLFLAGFSINWLISGKGDYFADNERGDELREKFKVESAIDEIAGEWASNQNVRDFLIAKFSSEINSKIQEKSIAAGDLNAIQEEKQKKTRKK